jgi:chemotaxis protein methyltransferase CheR
VERTGLHDEDVRQLLNDLIDRYGYDFTGYSGASLKRRIDRIYWMDQFPSFAEFRYRILNDAAYFKHFVEEFTVNVTEMLRDPSFYRTLRETVIPKLATYPFIRIWHAGCSTGEEVYSMAILLKECGLLNKSRLYATDLNSQVLETARKGIFPAGQMRQYAENYRNSGGARDFSAYYSANYNLVKFEEELGEKMIFATHNLVADASFNEFQLILCRNVMIYFNKELQARVLQLFDNSLETLGFLALGTKESLRFSHIESKYKLVVPGQKIWRKLK